MPFFRISVDGSFLKQHEDGIPVAAEVHREVTHLLLGREMPNLEPSEAIWRAGLGSGKFTHGCAVRHASAMSGGKVALVEAMICDGEQDTWYPKNKSDALYDALKAAGGVLIKAAGLADGKDIDLGATIVSVDRGSNQELLEDKGRVMLTVGQDWEATISVAVPELGKGESGVDTDALLDLPGCVDWTEVRNQLLAVGMKSASLSRAFSLGECGFCLTRELRSGTRGASDTCPACGSRRMRELAPRSKEESEMMEIAFNALSGVVGNLGVGSDSGEPDGEEMDG
jgi:hypothetical protein